MKWKCRSGCRTERVRVVGTGAVPVRLLLSSCYMSNESCGNNVQYLILLISPPYLRLNPISLDPVYYFFLSFISFFFFSFRKKKMLLGNNARKQLT